MSCVYTYNGVNYSYAELAAALHGGLLEKLVTDGVVGGEVKVEPDNAAEEVRVEPDGQMIDGATIGMESGESNGASILDYKNPIQIKIDVDENGGISDTKDSIVGKIKDSISAFGAKYKNVVASKKGNRYFVVTKDGKMFEVGRLFAHKGKPFPLTLNNKEWVEHAKSIEKTIKEKKSKQSESTEINKSSNLSSSHVGESVYYKGQKGIIEKDGGKYVITTSNNIYEFDENDFDLDDNNVVLATKKEENKKSYKVDVIDEKTAIVDGFEYSIIYDKKGNAVALTSKKNTIRTEKALIDTDIQVAKLPTTVAEYDVINKQLVSDGYAFNEIEAIDNMLSQNMTNEVANLLDNGFDGVAEQGLIELKLFIENVVSSIDKNFSDIKYAEDIKTQLIELQKIANNEYDNRFEEKSIEPNKETITSDQKINQEQDATKITSAESVDVGEPSQNGEEVGEGNAEENIAQKSEEAKEEVEIQEPDKTKQVKERFYKHVEGEYVEVKKSKPTYLFGTEKAFYTKEGNEYVVSDALTGAEIGRSKNASQAILNAEQNAGSADNLQKARERFYEAYGKSPYAQLQEQITFTQSLVNDAIGIGDVLDVKDTFENREIIEGGLKEFGNNVYYHGSNDISYLNSKEDLNTEENTKNAKSKYLNLSPDPSVAVSYSINQQKIGKNSGVAAFELKGNGYTMRGADIKALKSIGDYELFYDKKKSEGYDYVKVPQDANDIVVLNNNAIEYVGKKLNMETIEQSIKETSEGANISDKNNDYISDLENKGIIKKECE